VERNEPFCGDHFPDGAHLHAGQSDAESAHNLVLHVLEFLRRLCGSGERIGTILLEFCEHLGIGHELSRLIHLMQTSRMGFYTNRGSEGDLVILEELVTGVTRRAIVPAGDFGKKGELWCIRVLPSPFAGDSTHLAFTTPYIVPTPEPREWLAYFGRVLPSQSTIEDYERHMKFGPYGITGVISCSRPICEL
jgi:hypothetical protein